MQAQSSRSKRARRQQALYTAAPPTDHVYSFHPEDDVIMQVRILAAVYKSVLRPDHSLHRTQLHINSHKILMSHERRETLG
jgi:hypothetical protein